MPHHLSTFDVHRYVPGDDTRVYIAQMTVDVSHESQLFHVLLQNLYDQGHLQGVVSATYYFSRRDVFCYTIHYYDCDGFVRVWAYRGAPGVWRITSEFFFTPNTSSRSTSRTSRTTNRIKNLLKTTTTRLPLPG